jgi:hypothetical protein
MVMPRDNPAGPFYLIVTNHDRGVFAVEGPMTDDRPWQIGCPRGRQPPAPDRLRPDRRRP